MEKLKVNMQRKWEFSFKKNTLSGIPLLRVAGISSIIIFLLCLSFSTCNAASLLLGYGPSNTVSGWWMHRITPSTGAYTRLYRMDDNGQDLDIRMMTFNTSNVKIYGYGPSNTVSGWWMHKITPSTGAYTRLFQLNDSGQALDIRMMTFNPNNGKIYGYGPSNTVSGWWMHRITPSTGVYTRLYQMDDNGQALDIRMMTFNTADGKIYGYGPSNTVSGWWMHNITPSTGAYTRLFQLNDHGQALDIRMMTFNTADGKIYGYGPSNTVSGWWMHQIDPSTGAYTRLYKMNDNGQALDIRMLENESF